MPEVPVTLTLEKPDGEPSPGRLFSLELRDAHEPHLTRDATIDTGPKRTYTDEAGMAVLHVAETSEYTTGSGVYLVKVGDFLVEEITVPDGGDTLRGILDDQLPPEPD